MKARRHFAVVVLLVLFSVVAWAGDGMKPSSPQIKETLHSVIGSQLAAFRTGDYAAAYIFADPEMKAIMPLARFEKMVKQGYPVIAHSVSAQFGLTLDNGDEATVNVRVFGEREQSTSYQYILRCVDGNWRVAGVGLLKEQTTEA